MEFLDDLKETVRLNKIELLTMLKEYSLVYAQSVFFNLYDSTIRKKLETSFYKYYQEIQLENIYLKIIIDNIDLVEEERVNVFLDKLDSLNERTYQYHEQVLSSFEEKIYQKENQSFQLPYRNFTSITESNDYYLELLSTFINLDDIKISSEKRKINKILEKNQKKV